MKDALPRNETHFGAKGLSVICPKASTPGSEPTAARLARCPCCTKPVCQFANRLFTWQTPRGAARFFSWDTCGSYKRDFATRPTHTSGLLRGWQRFQALWPSHCRVLPTLPANHQPHAGAPRAAPGRPLQGVARSPCQRAAVYCRALPAQFRQARADHLPPFAGPCPILARLASLDGQLANDPGKHALDTFKGPDLLTSQWLRVWH